jgi:hypothetical protein
MGSHLDEYNAKIRMSKQERNRERLSAEGKENMGIISKAMPSSNKGSVGVLFRELAHTVEP